MMLMMSPKDSNKCDDLKHKKRVLLSALIPSELVVKKMLTKIQFQSDCGGK